MTFDIPHCLMPLTRQIFYRRYVCDVAGTAWKSGRLAAWGHQSNQDHPTALYQVIFLRLYVHMNQHETSAHRVRSSLKSQSATPKRSESVPSAFLHLLSGTLCHPASEILLPFHCLNPDSKLTCLRQLSASRISAVFSPRLPPLHLPPPPPPHECASWVF